MWLSLVYHHSLWFTTTQCFDATVSGLPTHSVLMWPSTTLLIYACINPLHWSRNELQPQVTGYKKVVFRRTECECCDIIATRHILLCAVVIVSVCLFVCVSVTCTCSARTATHLHIVTLNVIVVFVEYDHIPRRHDDTTTMFVRWR